MTTKPKKTGRQNYDWDSIKLEYVTSDISIREIAKKHSIGLQAVAKKSKADNWVAARKDYKEKSITKAITKASTENAKSLVRLDAVASKLIDRIEHIASEPDLTARDAKDLSTAIKNVGEYIGHQSPGQVEKQKLERERFELEKRIAASKAGNTDDETETGVVLMPPIAEED